MKGGFPRVTARIPFDPEILQILSRIPVQFRCVETYGGLGSNMLQIINLKSLFERLIPEFECRLKGSAAQSWRGVLGISIEKDRVQLGIDEGRIRLTEEEPSLKVSMPEVHLLRLILGLTSFDQLSEALGLRGKLNPPEADLLKGLFPSRIAFSGIWG